MRIYNSPGNVGVENLTIRIKLIKSYNNPGKKLKVQKSCVIYVLPVQNGSARTWRLQDLSSTSRMDPSELCRIHALVFFKNAVQMAFVRKIEFVGDFGNSHITMH